MIRFWEDGVANLAIPLVSRGIQHGFTALWGHHCYRNEIVSEAASWVALWAAGVVVSVMGGVGGGVDVRWWRAARGRRWRVVVSVVVPVSRVFGRGLPDMQRVGSDRLPCSGRWCLLVSAPWVACRPGLRGTAPAGASFRPPPVGGTQDCGLTGPVGELPLPSTPVPPAPEQQPQATTSRDIPRPDNFPHQPATNGGIPTGHSQFPQRPHNTQNPTQHPPVR